MREETSSQVSVFLVKVCEVCRAIRSSREGEESDKRHQILKKLDVNNKEENNLSVIF